MLAAEQQARHERFGASLYLLEPNLKQGIGALRDLRPRCGPRSRAGTRRVPAAIPTRPTR